MIQANKLYEEYKTHISIWVTNSKLTTILIRRLSKEDFCNKLNYLNNRVSQLDDNLLNRFVTLVEIDCSEKDFYITSTSLFEILNFIDIDVEGLSKIKVIELVVDTNGKSVLTINLKG